MRFRSQPRASAQGQPESFHASGLDTMGSGSRNSFSASAATPEITNTTATRPANQNTALTPSSSQKSRLSPTPPDEIHDLVGVGFGPASLAVAVALHDNLVGNPSSTKPKVLFLEKQNHFAWHAGMLLPGAKMQISFIKDMATLRDPRSHFTFLNYLHESGRLVEFTNLSTFLPARVEYEGYLRWCAGHFSDVVRYSSQVVSISPDPRPEGSSVKTFTITSRNPLTGGLTSVRTRNVLVAAGGQPSIPACLPFPHPKVIHSSQYAHLVPRLLPPNPSTPYRIAVVGAGQSAAEIFSNLQTLYPASNTYLVMRSEHLKPSDDSPFVNSIFNPAYTDSIFPRAQAPRRAAIMDAKATNYGVVRLELIEALYEKMYEQLREYGPDERTWPHRVMGKRDIVSVDEKVVASEGKLRLHVKMADDIACGEFEDKEELLDVDLVVSATGYRRDAHIDMLRDSWDLLPEVSPAGNGAAEQVDGWQIPDGDKSSRKLEVGRDYRVKYAPGAVADEAGVWLQGCCEMTHGLSDTLLSVLAARSGEIVNSIFPFSNTVKAQL